MNFVLFLSRSSWDFSQSFLSRFVSFFYFYEVEGKIPVPPRRELPTMAALFLLSFFFLNFHLFDYRLFFSRTFS